MKKGSRQQESQKRGKEEARCSLCGGGLERVVLRYEEGECLGQRCLGCGVELMSQEETRALVGRWLDEVAHGRRPASAMDITSMLELLGDE